MSAIKTIIHRPDGDTSTQRLPEGILRFRAEKTLKLLLEMGLEPRQIISLAENPHNTADIGEENAPHAG